MNRRIANRAVSFRTNSLKANLIRNPVWFFNKKEPNGILHKFSFAGFAVEEKILRNDTRRVEVL